MLLELREYVLTYYSIYGGRIFKSYILLCILLVLYTIINREKKKMSEHIILGGIGLYYLLIVCIYRLDNIDNLFYLKKNIFCWRARCVFINTVFSIYSYGGVVYSDI